MKKYLDNHIDTQLRQVLNIIEHDRLKQLVLEMAFLLVEINRLEENRIKRYKNLMQRKVRSKTLMLVQKQIGKIIG